jgi:hypothetical protein
MLQFLFPKRVRPAIIAKRPIPLRKSRLPLVVFLVTHGLWLATSLAGLIFAVSDAYPKPGMIVAASSLSEPQ